MEFYPELFDSDFSGGSTTQAEINFGKKWKSYASLIQLANGDITRIDEITNLPLETCLLKLAYDADRAELEKMLYENATNRVQM